MRLAKRKNGDWVIVCRHTATGQECEAPFGVFEQSGGRFELWSWASDDAEEMTLREGHLSKKGVLDLAETLLPAGLSA